MSPSTGGGGSLIDHAADYFKSRQTPVQEWFKDDNGRYAFRVTLEDQRYVVCAKKYVNHGRASFMTDKVLRRAVDLDALVVLFVAETGGWAVFDPRQALTHGTESSGKSKRAKNEDWMDVSTSWAVSLEDHVEGRDSPTWVPPSDLMSGRNDKTSTDGKTSKTNTNDGRPSKPWDVTSWTDR